MRTLGADRRVRSMRYNAKRLSDAELRAELGARGASSTGSRVVLIDRLVRALCREIEELMPDTPWYEFDEEQLEARERDGCKTPDPAGDDRGLLVEAERFPVRAEIHAPPASVADARTRFGSRDSAPTSVELPILAVTSTAAVTTTVTCTVASHAVTVPTMSVRMPCSTPLTTRDLYRITLHSELRRALASEGNVGYYAEYLHRETSVEPPESVKPQPQSTPRARHPTTAHAAARTIETSAPVRRTAQSYNLDFDTIEEVPTEEIETENTESEYDDEDDLAAHELDAITKRERVERSRREFEQELEERVRETREARRTVSEKSRKSVPAERNRPRACEIMRAPETFHTARESLSGHDTGDTRASSPVFCASSPRKRHSAMDPPRPKRRRESDNDRGVRRSNSLRSAKEYANPKRRDPREEPALSRRHSYELRDRPARDRRSCDALLIDSSSSSDSDSDESEYASVASRRSTKPSLRLSESANAIKILRQWNVKFSGEGKGEDPEEFLDNVSDCVVGSSIPEHVMLSALPCVLQKRAARWYRTARADIRSWKEFARAFRRHFIAEYDRADLWDDLHKRTQGKNEKISEFLANFRYIVAKFKKPPSERDQLSVAYRNILPEYRRAMADRRRFRRRINSRKSRNRLREKM